MVGLVERKVAKSAFWSRRIALFAAPFLGAAVLLHRFEKVTSEQVIGLLAFGFLLLVLAVVLAIRALFTLWNTGAKGGRAMVSGLFVSLILAVPFIVMAAFALQFPALNDVATNVFDPSEFSEQTIAHRASDGVRAQNDVSAPYDEDKAADILSAYPKLGPRRYPAGAERVYAAAKILIIDRGWVVLYDSAKIETKPETDENASEEAHKKKADKNEEAADDGLELAVPDDINIDVLTTSLIFRFKNDATIEIISEAENTLVQMRSAARWGRHDFGANARLIEKFLGDLDAALIGIAGEG